MFPFWICFPFQIQFICFVLIYFGSIEICYYCDLEIWIDSESPNNEDSMWISIGNECLLEPRSLLCPPRQPIIEICAIGWFPDCAGRDNTELNPEVRRFAPGFIHHRGVCRTDVPPSPLWAADHFQQSRGSLVEEEKLWTEAGGGRTYTA